VVRISIGIIFPTRDDGNTRTDSLNKTNGTGIK